MYVADFIGSPPMNFIRFNAGLQRGSRVVRIGEADVQMPEIRSDVAPGELALGVRPEHIRFNHASKLRGAIYGSEYLGTNQIVTVETSGGLVRARMPADRSYAIGDQVGLTFASERLSLFECDTGRAVPSSLNDGTLLRQVGHLEASNLEVHHG